MPPGLVRTVVALREAHDRGSATIPQAAFAAFVEGGHLGRHVRRTRALCLRRQGALVDAIREHPANVLEVDPSPAGLHLVARLLGEADSEGAVLLAANAGVTVVALSSYAAEAKPPAALVLGYAPYSETAIRTAVAAIQEALS